MARTIPRRHFLRWSAGALAAPALSRSAIARQDTAAARRPVVVVGAGISGLHAASMVREAGHDVMVLEARATPGGRVLTLRAPFDEGLYGEAGAVRIAPQHERVRRLVAKHDLSLVPFISTNGSALIRAAGVTVRTPEDVAQLAETLALRADERGRTQGALLQRYVGDVLEELASATTSDGRWRALDDVTWPAWLLSRGASPGAVRLMTLGGDSRNLSALYVLRQFVPLHATTQYFKIHGGMDLLPHAMARTLGAAIRYRAVVGRLTSRADRVDVEFTQAGRRELVEASRVVVTVPLSTLARIEMRPGLPGRIVEAVAATQYFPAVRVLMQTRERFWHDQDVNASARTDDPAEFWDCSYDLPAGRGLLGMTVGGDLGRGMTGLSRAAALDRAVGVAAETFPTLSSYYEKGTIYRWSADEWARGAFAVFSPGGASATMPEVYRPAGRVHFAGEHSSSWWGWMEGALESAERVAAEVLAA